MTKSRKESKRLVILVMFLDACPSEASCAKERRSKKNSGIPAPRQGYPDIFSKSEKNSEYDKHSPVVLESLSPRRELGDLRTIHTVVLGKIIPMILSGDPEHSQGSPNSPFKKGTSFPRCRVLDRQRDFRFVRNESEIPISNDSRNKLCYCCFLP